MVLSESFRRRRTAAGAVDRVDDRLHDLQDVAAEALSLAIVAVLQAVCLADQMCQAALALLEVAVDVVAVAHQPVAEGFTEHFTHDRTRAPSDDEQGGGGTGEHPQPQQLSGLLPTGLIGPLDVNDQVDVAQGLQHLRIHHRLHCTPGVVALLNPRTTCQSGQGCSTGDSLMRWSKEAGRGVLGIYLACTGRHGRNVRGTMTGGSDKRRPATVGAVRADGWCNFATHVKTQARSMLRSKPG